MTVLNFFVQVEQETLLEIICFSTVVETTSGEYRSRTDDPLLAKQVLQPAELHPRDSSSPGQIRTADLYIISVAL